MKNKSKKKRTCDCEYRGLNKNDKEDVKSAKEYCERHLQYYTTHESIKPVWCKECGYLDMYLVKIGKRKDVKKRRESSNV